MAFQARRGGYDDGNEVWRWRLGCGALLYGRGGGGGEQRRSAGEVGFNSTSFKGVKRRGRVVGLMREGGGAVQRLVFSWCISGAQRRTMAAVRMGGGGASIRRRETTPGVGQAGPDGLMTRAVKEKFQEKK
jgi:hypothetical protein